MEMSLSEKDGLTCLTLAGEIDLHVSTRLRDQLQKLAADRTPALAIDFKDVEYIDSSGLATLIEYVRQVGGFKGKLFLCALQPKVRMVFDLVRLNELFEIFPDLESVQKRLRNKPKVEK